MNQNGTEHLRDRVFNCPICTFEQDGRLCTKHLNELIEIGREQQTMNQNDTSTDGTDSLLNHFRDNSVVEVDHAISLYLESGAKLPWSDIALIREEGYKIQDVTNGDRQTKITIVRNTESEPTGENVSDL